MSDEQEVEAAMRRAWRVLWEVWPRKFHDGEWNAKKGMFLKRIYDLDPAVIVEAAEHLVVSKDFPPTPNEFFVTAMRLHKERHPHAPVAKIECNDPEMLALALNVKSKQERLDAVAKYILRYCTTGKFSELSAIWALLWEMCETRSERQAVQDGTVSKRTVNAAITAHREGRRARVVPFSVMGRESVPS